MTFQNQFIFLHSSNELFRKTYFSFNNPINIIKDIIFLIYFLKGSHFNCLEVCSKCIYLVPHQIWWQPMLEKHHFRILNTRFDYIMLNDIETFFIQSETVKISLWESRRSSGRIIHQSQFTEIFSFPQYFDDGMFQISITIEQKNIVESRFLKMHQILLL